MIEQVKRITNPLTVIAIFAGLAEISSTVVLPFLQNGNQFIFLWFVMIFPVLLICFFFATLNWNHLVLYAPTDYREDKSFLQAIRHLTADEQVEKLTEDAAAYLQQPVEPPPPKPEGSVSPQAMEEVPPSPVDSTAAIMAAAMQAEDLVLKEVQLEFDVSIARDMGIEGKPGLKFDALVIQREKRAITAIEVKYLRTVHFPHKLIQRALQIGDAFAKDAIEHGHRPRFILAIATDVDEKTHGHIERRVSALREQALFPPEIRIYKMADLQRKYGLQQ